MKKIFAFIFTIASVLTLVSCGVTSLQPLVTYDKIMTDKRVAGQWLDKKNDGPLVTVEPLPESKLVQDISKGMLQSRKVFAFTGDPVKDSILFSRGYVISYEEDGVFYSYIGALMKSGDNLFIDIYPLVMHDPKVREDAATPFDFNYDYLPGFTMAKVVFNANEMTLVFVDGDFIREQLEAGNMKLKHESDGTFGSFMITASSKELQLFVEKYANDERIFNKNNSITLMRQAGHL
jgi:hypothetical protein